MRASVFEARFFAGDFEERGDLRGERAGAGHARGEVGIVELAAAHRADFADEFMVLLRQVSTEPFLKEVFDGIRQMKCAKASMDARRRAKANMCDVHRADFKW